MRVRLSRPLKCTSAIRDAREQILSLGQAGSEIEYEQMLIRANNCESHLNTDYFIIDRRFVTRDGKGRFDLVGILQPHRSWAHRAPLPLALLELKFGLNADIQALHKQLGQYHRSVSENMEGIVDEAERLLRQKLELGFLGQPVGRLQALGRARISRDINEVRFGIVLVDYHPSSELFARTKRRLEQPEFWKQIDIFHVGFGLWQQRANRLCPGPVQ